MVTSMMLGAFREDSRTRREFLAMIRNPDGDRKLTCCPTLRLFDTVEKLIAFDTVSRNSNLQLIDVRTRICLRALGARFASHL